MAKSKYRGKYPTRICSTWGTTTKGVYGCTTNAGVTYFFSTAAMLRAGYTVSASQLMGMCATTLPFLHTSVALATAHHAVQWALLQFTQQMAQGRRCHALGASHAPECERHLHQRQAAQHYANASQLRETYTQAQQHYTHMQGLLG